MPSGDRKLSVRLVGDDADKGLVRLEDFSELCAHLRKALRDLESDITNRKPSVGFRIVDLQCKSAALAIEPVPSKNGRDLGREVVHLFRDTVQELQSPRPQIDERINLHTLRSLKKLYEPILKSRQNSHKRLRVEQVDLDATFVANINKLLDAPIRSLGSVKGRLEMINLHNKREFVIWPTLHNAKVVCRFEEALWPKVRDAIKQHVTIYGQLFYQSERPYPVHANVNDIEIHPPESEITKLSEMRGILKSSRDYRSWRGSKR